MTNELWVDLWAGWIAGAASVLAVQPVDHPDPHAGHAFGARRGRERESASRGARRGGARALWRGAAPMTAVIPAQNALLFAGYGVGERWASRRVGQRLRPRRFVPRVAAPRLLRRVAGGVLQSFAASPFELVKIRQQAAGGAVTLAVSTLTGNLGRVGLCTRGLGATLLRDGVPHGVWFAAYEWSKRRMVQASRDDDDDEATTSRRTDAAVPLCAGAFAAAVAWGVGYPADLVKTRVQAQAAKNGRAGFGGDVRGDASRERRGRPQGVLPGV